MPTDPVSAFLARWKNASGTERSNYQRFVAELCKRASTLPEQMRAVADLLATSRGTLDEASLASHFTGRGAWKSRLPQILATLEALGRARRVKDAWTAA